MHLSAPAPAIAQQIAKITNLKNKKSCRKKYIDPCTPIYFSGRTALLLCREKTPSLSRDFACARCAHLRYIRQSAVVRTAAALTTKRLALYASKGRRQRNAAPHHRHTGSERLRPLTFQVSRWRRGLVQHPLRRGKGQVRAYRYQNFERTRLSVDR